MQLVNFLANFSSRHLKYASTQSGVFSLSDYLTLTADFTFSLPSVSVFHKAIHLWTSVAELAQEAAENHGPR